MCVCVCVRNRCHHSSSSKGANLCASTCAAGAAGVRQSDRRPIHKVIVTESESGAGEAEVMVERSRPGRKPTVDEVWRGGR